MRIGKFDTKEKVLVVAEIGNNHEGNFETAEELVRRAAATGAHAVKLQTFRTEHYVSGADESRFKRLKSFELSFDQFGALARLAHSLGLLFISTPFDLESANFLAGTADALKIASGDNNFYPLIARAAESGKPLIVSTGLSDLAQVKRTVKFIEDKWGARRAAGHLAILHCVSAYPVPPEQANLRAIPFLAKLLSCTVGYSDHTLGLEAAVTAVALGARIIEKHFTLDKNYSSFRDHQLSADFFEMSELVKRVQLVNSMLGRPEKKVLAAEEGNITAIRRSIVAGRDLPQGHRIALADLTWIRPGGGLEPGSEHTLLGKALKRPASFGEKLLPADVE